MGRFLQYALAGLSAGSLYALVALGLVLIYRSTRVLNFAHGDLATFGTYVAFAAITGGMSLGIALPIAILVGAVIAVVFYFGAVVPAQRKGASPLGTVILTSGLALILQGLTVYRWERSPTAFRSRSRTARCGSLA